MNVELLGGRTVTRVTLIGLVVTLAAPLGAQQMIHVSSQQQENALKNNVTAFEIMLRQSVVSAGNKLANWAGQIAPGITLAFAEQPTVRSVPLPDNSLIFHVEVWPIMPTSLGLFAQVQRQRENPSTRVGNSGGLPAGDAKGPDSIPPINMTPDQYYTSLVREALIDAMLDGSGMLQLKDGQSLHVACTPVEMAGPVLRNPSRELVLTIKAEDLLAYRQGTLTKDQAKQRIIERRF